MKTSDQGLRLIKEFEGFRSKAYQDQAGVWTLGWGHTVGVREGDDTTVAVAEQWIRQDAEYAEQVVSASVTAPCTQNQFDALVSFVFNIGPGRFGVRSGFVVLKSGGPSMLLKSLNDRRYDDASVEFDKWVFAGGKKSDGLIKRRAAERKLFDSLIQTADTTDSNRASLIEELRKIMARAAALVDLLK